MGFNQFMEKTLPLLFLETGPPVLWPLTFCDRRHDDAVTRHQPMSFAGILRGFCILCSLLPLHVIGEPVEWSQNGHFYEVIPVPEGIDWSDANSAAMARGGYLATLTSPEENAFVYGLTLLSPGVWYASNEWMVGPWLGGADADAEGSWGWVTGESWGYTAWMGGQPDNWQNEDYLAFWARSAAAATWNDSAGGALMRGYVVEYSSDETPPDVTVNQAATQPDPTNAQPINFTVVFSEPVIHFENGDVTITGTAGGDKIVVVTGSGSTYNVAVSGVTSSGTVIASLAAAVAEDEAGNPSHASTSTDTTVTVLLDHYTEWAGGLPADQRGAELTPQGDGIPNLMKYACNLDPLAPDVALLTSGGNETKGLPLFSVVEERLRVEFLRRKAETNPGISYIMQFSPDLAPSSWTNLDVSSSPSGISIDGEWERVTVEAPAGEMLRFGRLKVTQP